MFRKLPLSEGFKDTHCRVTLRYGRTFHRFVFFHVLSHVWKWLGKAHFRPPLPWAVKLRPQVRNRASCASRDAWTNVMKFVWIYFDATFFIEPLFEETLRWRNSSIPPTPPLSPFVAVLCNVCVSRIWYGTAHQNGRFWWLKYQGYYYVLCIELFRSPSDLFLCLPYLYVAYFSSARV